MKLLVGLGNPGPQYVLNRHNVGFMIIDLIAHVFSFPQFQLKDNAHHTEKTIDGIKIRLMKPVNFMNRSGPPVAQVANFYKIPLDEILVFHDELDLDFGDIRTKHGGGSAGHNGLKSLDSHLGKDYWRLRIGIGHPGHRDAVSDYVLSNFSKAEQEELPFILGPLADHLEVLLSDGPEAYVQKAKE